MIRDIILAVKDIVSEFIEDPDKASELADKVAERANQVVLAEMEIQKKQIEVNIESAKHSSIFVSGARPGFLWLCLCAYAHEFFIYRYVNEIFDISVPPINDGILWALTGGLLGIGGMKTWEKLNGVARSNLREPNPKKKVENQ